MIESRSLDNSGEREFLLSILLPIFKKFADFAIKAYIRS